MKLFFETMSLFIPKKKEKNKRVYIYVLIALQISIFQHKQYFSTLLY